MTSLSEIELADMRSLIPVVGDRIEVYFRRTDGVDDIHARGVLVAIVGGDAVILCDPGDTRGQGEHWPATFRFTDQVRREQTALDRLGSSIWHAQHALKVAMSAAKEPPKRSWFFGLRKQSGPDELTMTALAAALDALRGVHGLEGDRPTNFADQIMYETPDGLTAGETCSLIIPEKLGQSNAGEQFTVTFLCEYRGWRFIRYQTGYPRPSISAYPQASVFALKEPEGCPICGK
jgi:hypothetical protein